jgi:iron complex outermembrane receptor protein
VLVTAQKREQNVQDVPIAIDAMSRDAILAQRISGPDDLVKQFPNLSLKTASAVNSGFAIRGVGTNNFHLTAQQAVGLYFDEVSQVTPFTSQLGLFDMERIEVLRGPQNTLFGRNTTGGAVNFITRRPNPEDGNNGYVNLNAGNFGKLDGEGRDGLCARRKFRSPCGGADPEPRRRFHRRGIRREDRPARIASRRGLGLAWVPSEDTSAWLSLHYGKSDPERVRARPPAASSRTTPRSVH